MSTHSPSLNPSVNRIFDDLNASIERAEDHLKKLPGAERVEHCLDTGPWGVNDYLIFSRDEGLLFVTANDLTNEDQRAQARPVFELPINLRIKVAAELHVFIDKAEAAIEGVVEDAQHVTSLLTEFLDRK